MKSKAACDLIIPLMCSTAERKLLSRYKMTNRVASRAAKSSEAGGLLRYLEAANRDGRGKLLGGSRLTLLLR